MAVGMVGMVVACTEVRVEAAFAVVEVDRQGIADIMAVS